MQAYSDHFAPAPGPQAYAPESTSSSLPYTPLPKRRGTGPTVALVAVALIIPALIFGVRALAGDGDGAGGSDQVATEPEGTDPEPVDPEPVDPEPVDPEPVDPELTGPKVEAAAYAYAIPQGWDRRPDMARDFDLDEGDSVVAVSRPDHGFDTNVLVSATAAGNLDTVDEARDAWLPDSGSFEDLEPATLDGVGAIGIRRESRNDAGRPIVQLGYLTVRDQQIYSIVLSVPVESETNAQTALDAVLASWTWAEREPATGEPAASTA
jgi:hypothetical protein